MIIAAVVLTACGGQKGQNAPTNDSTQTVKCDSVAMSTPTALTSLDSLAPAGTVRTMGKLVAARFADLSFETALPVFISAVYMSFEFDMWQFGAQFSGIFCMLGHCFPVWYGFKGGKAFIAGFATIWFVDWRMTLIAMAIFFLLLFTLKYMSVASCTAAFSCPVSLFYLGYSNAWVEVLAVAAAALVIVRHYPNFVKLVHGTESKFSLSSKN